MPWYRTNHTPQDNTYLKYRPYVHTLNNSNSTLNRLKRDPNFNGLLSSIWGTSFLQNEESLSRWLNVLLRLNLRKKAPKYVISNGKR